MMAIRAGECEVDLAVGSEKLSNADLLGASTRHPADTWSAQGPVGAVATSKAASAPR